MSVNVTTYYAQQYAKIINQLVQQEKSRLRQAVTEERYIGKAGSPVEQVGLINMQPVTSRYAPMGRVDAPTDRRWVYPADFDLPQLLDSFDQVRLLVDPKGKFVQNGHAAAERQIDDLLISAMFGTAKTGETGQNSIAAPSFVSVSQGSSGPTGLTVAKIREAKRILLANEAIEMGSPEVYCVAGAKQLDNLLAEAQVVSTDFNSTQAGAPILRDGVIERFLGVNFIHSERLPTGTDDAAGTSTKVMMWHKMGMHLGIWNDVTTDIAQRKDLQGLPWQSYIYLTMGGTRLEEKRCQPIWAR